LFAIADLQQEAQEPGRMAGVNFFQPLPRSALVEVVRSDRTDEKVARKLAEWVAWLGKLPLLVHDLPGLVVYRVLLPYLSEAVRLVSEGVNPDRVDEAMRRFGMSQGPLEYLDQMGLDKAERLAEIIEPILGDRFPSQPAFALMAEQGWLGQKAGLGFYRHGRRPKVHQAAVDLCIQAREVPALTEPTTPREQAEAVRRRLVGLLINEAARCLAEGRVGSAPAVDLAMVLGGGWPAHRGGPLAYAEQSGYTMWVQTLEELARSRGGHYAPSAELRRLAGL
jgi:3-hydroxyacyl-CoA dehydrogenase/enoyl-CoA hydratase/3-hydroxybutyryl-CoA epimerase